MVVHSILLRCLAQDEKVLAVHSFHLLLICRIVVTTGISIYKHVQTIKAASAII